METCNCDCHKGITTYHDTSCCEKVAQEREKGSLEFTWDKSELTLRDWREEWEKLWTIGSIGVQIQFGRFSTAKEIEKEFIKQTLASRNAAFLEYIEGQKKKPTLHSIPCPDKMEGCCVYHAEIYLSDDDEIFNKALELVEQFIKDNE